MTQFRLTLMAGSLETPPGRFQMSDRFYVFKQQREDIEKERQAILSEFGVSGGPIGKKSRFGEVYLGVYSGKPVAVKLERRDSKELPNIKRIKFLRTQAPQNIKNHLPVIYLADTGSYWSYYVMEPLQEAPEEVVKDLFGGDYQIQKELEDDLIKQPELINLRPHELQITLNRKTWADRSLFDSAFDAWWEHKHIDSAVIEEYRKTIFAAIQNIPSKTDGATDSKAAAEHIGQYLHEQIRGDAKKFLDGIIPRLPELLYAIAQAGYLSREHPQNKNWRKYDHLRQSPIEEYHKDMQNTLEWLSEHGLRWGDVHGGNIMMRPSTRDIVFIDFGLYHAASSEFRLVKK